MKKLTAIICALAMILILCSCTGITEKKTVTGKVTKIDGTKITLLLGEITEATGDAQTPPEKSDGESGNAQGTPPEKPDGESDNLPCRLSLRFHPQEKRATVLVFRCSRS